MISEPNYKRATNKAYNVLLQYRLETCPINLKLLVFELPTNIRIFSYSQFSDSILMHYNFSSIAPSKHGFIVYNKNIKKYILCYNDEDNIPVYRFTIAHELGHYFLNHMIDNNYTNKEANCFARNLLSPVPIIERLSIYDTKNLINWFNLSYSAAKIRQKYIVTDLINISIENKSNILKIFTI